MQDSMKHQNGTGYRIEVSYDLQRINLPKRRDLVEG
jgi:hypothetical protein